jgi:hypothetical protein
MWIDSVLGCVRTQFGGALSCVHVGKSMET